MVYQSGGRGGGGRIPAGTGLDGGAIPGAGGRIIGYPGGGIYPLAICGIPGRTGGPLAIGGGTPIGTYIALPIGTAFP